MKAVIKILLLIGVLLLTVLFIWAKPILETVGTNVLDRPLKIKKARFVPYKLSFQMEGISIPDEKVFFPKGTISLIPLKITLKGIKAPSPVNIGEENFTVMVTRKLGWQLDAVIKNYDLRKIAGDYGVKKGTLNGRVQGTYKKKTLFLDGIMSFGDISVDNNQELFGLTADDIKSILKQNRGRVEMDFTYKGPPDQLDNWTYYQPGKKSMSLLSAYLIKRLS